MFLKISYHLFAHILILQHVTYPPRDSYESLSLTTRQESIVVHLTILHLWLHIFVISHLTLLIEQESKATVILPGKQNVMNKIFLGWRKAILSMGFSSMKKHIQHNGLLHFCTWNMHVSNSQMYVIHKLVRIMRENSNRLHPRFILFWIHHCL